MLQQKCIKFLLFSEFRKIMVKSMNQRWLSQTTAKMKIQMQMQMQMKMKIQTEDDDRANAIPDYVPLFEELPEMADILKEASNEIELIESNEMSQIISESDTDTYTDTKELIKTDKSGPTIDLIKTNNDKKNPCTFDITANLNQFPPILNDKPRFTLDLQSEAMQKVKADSIASICDNTPTTTDEANNWITPPWLNDHFVVPPREGSHVSQYSQYPEIFGYKRESSSSSALVNESDAKDSLQKKIEAEKPKIKKDTKIVSRVEIYTGDETWKRNARIVLLSALFVAYYFVRIKPEMNTFYETELTQYNRIQQLKSEFSEDFRDTSQIRIFGGKNRMESIKDDINLEIKHPELTGVFQSDRSPIMFKRIRNTEKE